jgi:hypothetical protein
MNSIAAVAIRGIVLCSILCGCAKEELVEPKEAILILAPIQGVEDSASVHAAQELSALLQDLHLYLFPNDPEEPAESLQECFPDLVIRMTAWRQMARSPHSSVLSLEPGLYYGAWDGLGLQNLAAKYPLEEELWDFFEVAAGFMWDSAPSTSDTYLCLWIWSQSPLRGEAVRDFEWEPTIEPVLHRVVLELRGTVDLFDEFDGRGFTNVFGCTPNEFKTSFLNDVQNCFRFIEEENNGNSPNPSVVVEAMEEHYLKVRLQMAVNGMKRFQDRLN